MLPTQRTCIIESHKMINSTHICTYDQCNQVNRWICIQCVLKSIHLHGLQNQEHIMDQEQFNHFVCQIEKHKMDYYDSQLQNIQKLVKISKEIKEIIMLVLQFLENESNRIKEINHIQLIQQISQLAKQDFQLISNEQISKVVSIKDTLFECNYDSCRKYIQQITLISKELENLISSIDKKQITQNNNDDQEDIKTCTIKQFNKIIIPMEEQTEQLKKQPQIVIPPLDYKQSAAIIIPRIDDEQSIQSKQMKEQFGQKEQNKNAQLVQNRQYQTYFERNSKSQINTIEISPDERYLIVGTNDKDIQIFDLNSQQLIKTITLNSKAMIVKFTADSKYIFCGDQGGYLSIYEISIFKEIFSKQLHSLSLNGFKIIDNYQIITCSSDKSIIITNIQQNEQVIQIKYAHNEEINSVDHDQEQDVIISCSVDQSIKLFNRKNGSFLFQSNNAHKFSIQKIQFIQKNKTLISSNLNQLKIWQIDYKKQLLVKLKEISDDSMIFNFTFLNNYDQIIVINKQNISIYDQDLKLIKKSNTKINQILYVLSIIRISIKFPQLYFDNQRRYQQIIILDYMKVMKQKLNQ